MQNNSENPALNAIEAMPIENKEGNERFFTEGLKWYITRFQYIFIERFWMSIYFLFIIIFTLIVIANIFILFPLKNSIPFARYTDSVYEEIPIIKNLYNIYSQKDSLQTVVSKYLVSQYVINTESYNFSNIEDQNNYIKNNSFYTVYDAFFAEVISKNNINSFISKYQNQAEITIEINNLEITAVPNKKGTYYALVEFDSLMTVTATKTSRDNKSVISDVKAKKKVRLEFRIANILLAYKKIVPLEFVVTKYEKL